MRIGRASALAAVALAAAAGAAYVVVGPQAPWSTDEGKPVIEGVRQPLFPDAQPRTVALAIGGEQAEPVRKGDQTNTQVAAVPTDAAPDGSQRGAGDAPPTESPQPSEADDRGDVTPTLEGRTKRAPGRRGLTILHIGDSHTSADFLTGE